MQKANATYSYFLRLILEIIKANLFFAIEDPRGGWMWSFVGYVSFLAMKGMYVVDLQACAFVVARDQS